MKVIIVGAGIHGLCLAWALAREGHAVTVIDRHTIPNPLNASYDQHRLIHDFNRLANDDPTITQAFAAWQALSCDIGPLYVETGAVCGFADAAHAAPALDGLRNSGVAAHLLDEKELRNRLPGLRPDPGCCAIATTRGGILLADQIAILLTDWLARRNVKLRPNTTVASLDLDCPAAVLADGESVPADIVVACAGAATIDLFPMLAGSVGARRQLVAYVDPPPRLVAAWRQAPVFVNFGGSDDFWGAPPAATTQLKLAAGRLARPGSPANPDERIVTAAETEALLDCCRDRLVQFDTYRVLRVGACFYSIAPQQHVVQCSLDFRHCVWMVAGHNGSDYKLAPALALRLATRLSRHREGSRPADAR
ncbi:MAG: FAD-binding oxidoreductase [Pseudomonadota bacterium]|jgi:glycine/D-amino acid oxidase-like deaminating enzyme